MCSREETAEFYLIMDVAVGGTNGWFPDGAGNKPWLDGSLTAMHDFAEAQDTWYATWPQDPKQRGMVMCVYHFIPVKLERISSHCNRQRLC